MSEPVFVIQSIVDGADGYPYDEVLSIAICKVDLDAGTVETVFDETVNTEPKVLGKTKLDYAEARGFKVADLYEGKPVADIVARFHEIVDGNNVVSYENQQQFDKYLSNDPWSVIGHVNILPSISTKQPISLRCKYPEDEPEIIVKAYRKAFRNDPAGIGKKRNALALAQMASYVAIHMRGRGKYKYI